MAKSLADLRTTPPTERPRRSLDVCLRPDLVARIQVLTGKIADLPEPEVKRERKMAEGTAPLVESPEAAAMRSELAACLSEMAEHSGQLVVEANWTDGEWRNWVDAHPPRAEGQPGYDRDKKVASGIANADALLETLGDFAHSYNDEPLAADDWARVFEPVLPTGDKIEMARMVVDLYESRLDFRQWQTALSTGLQRWQDSVEHEASESAPSGSTGGSPAQSSAATTKTATKSPSRKPGKSSPSAKSSGTTSNDA